MSGPKSNRKAEAEQSRRIEVMLRKAQMEENKIVKILLLGESIMLANQSN